MWMIKHAGALRAALLPRARAECGEAAPGGSVGRSWSAPCGRLSLPRDGCCDPGSSLCRCRPGPPHPPSPPTPLPHCQTLSLQHTPAGLGNTVNMCVLLPDLLNQDHFQLFFTLLHSYLMFLDVLSWKWCHTYATTFLCEKNNSVSTITFWMLG